VVEGRCGGGSGGGVEGVVEESELDRGREWVYNNV